MRRVGFLLTLLVVAATLTAALGPISLIGPAAQHVEAAGMRFVVNSQEDAVDADPGDGECRTAEGECTLRAAVMEANAQPGLDAVEVPTGTYPVSLPGEPDDHGDPSSVGDIDITDELELVGAGPEATVVKGPGGYEKWSVFGVSEGVSVTLASLQVREGSGAFGGGVESDGFLRLRQTWVVSNTGGFGGGVLSNGSLEVVDSRFERNVSSHGGGILFDLKGTGETASLLRSHFEDNHPVAIDAFSGGTVRVTDSDLISNTTGIKMYDGAVIAVGSRLAQNEKAGIRVDNGFATVYDSVISGNGEGLAGSSSALRALASEITANNGSGVADRNKGEVIVATTNVVSNTSAFGGGISMSNQGALTVIDSTVAANKASHGGGIYVGNGGEHYVENSTISDNHASIGGDIRNGGDLTLVNTTVRTTVGEGRGIGINNSSTIRLNSSVVAAEPPAVSCARSTAGEILSEGNNVASDDSCGLDEDLDDLEGVDPLLGPLADNGGRTVTHALSDGSPAIDHGDEFNCPDLDQRGAARPQGEGCDSGSFEYGAEAPPVPTPDRDFEITDVRVFGYARSGPDGAEPVVGTTVTVQALPGRCISPVVTDDRGAFETTCPEAHLLGGVKVTIRADGYQTWRGRYMLGPYAEESGPVSVAALLDWEGGPTPTPDPEPSETPEPGFELHVPAAYNATPVR